MQTYDLAVIGSGPGGAHAAVQAARRGMRVVVIERDQIGGVCVNWGCIPSKSLLQSAQLYHTVKKQGMDCGLTYQELRPNYAAAVKRSRRVARRLSGGVAVLFKQHGIDTIEATAKLGPTGQIILNEQEADVIQAEHILLATGVQARSLPGVAWDGQHICHARQAIVREQLPARVAIIGAGAIGLEFASIYRDFGSEVWLLELLPHLLPSADGEISQMLAKEFQKRRIRIFTNTQVTKAQLTENAVSVVIEQQGKSTSLTVDMLLVAVGVEPCVSGLGLDQAGVALDAHGFIKVNQRFQTSVAGIWAIGDVIGPPFLAHVATSQATAAVQAMCDENPIFDANNIPTCVYSRPQVASIGLTEEQVQERALKYRIGRASFLKNGKALAIGESAGMVKLIFAESTQWLLGAHLIGPEVTELLTQLTLLKKLQQPYPSWANTIYAHPTLGETIMAAAADAWESSNPNV